MVLGRVLENAAISLFRALWWYHCHSHHTRGNWLDENAILSALCLHQRWKFFPRHHNMRLLKLLRVSGSNFANSSVTALPFSMVLWNLFSSEDTLGSGARNTHGVHTICLWIKLVAAFQMKNWDSTKRNKVPVLPSLPSLAVTPEIPEV